MSTKLTKYLEEIIHYSWFIDFNFIAQAVIGKFVKLWSKCFVATCTSTKGKLKNRRSSFVKTALTKRSSLKGSVRNCNPPPPGDRI